MNGESLNILKDSLEKLKADFPEVFTECKTDIEKFKATFTDDINFNNERYVLNWAEKSDAFKVLQIPNTATLKTHPEQSVNFNITENIFIEGEGENLEVLKVLQKSYYGKIKCIMIDHPYNNGNDSFIYLYSFKENKGDYEKRISDKAESKPLDLGFKALKLSWYNFNIWRDNEINEENPIQQLDAFTNPVQEGSEQENRRYELILKAGYALTDKAEKIDNFYSIRNNELIMATDKISKVSIDKTIALKPEKTITRNILFKDNDQLKTNTVSQMREARVDFKTI